MSENVFNIVQGLGMQVLPLEEAAKVRMMNRVDKKYWFHTSELPALFNAVKNDYMIQTIEGRQWQQYVTQYFDTADNKMYTLHHNGKLNRYKIRRRDYIDSDDHFLEVKFKTNQGRTIKKRVKSTDKTEDFTDEEGKFICDRSIFCDEQLLPSLKNTFTRMTLINKDMKERATIDIDLIFSGVDQDVDMNALVILELKSEKGAKDTSLKRYLRDARIKSGGFSKYCVGRVLTDKNIKRNRFKQRIREIGKLLDQPDLYNI